MPDLSSRTLAASAAALAATLATGIAVATATPAGDHAAISKIEKLVEAQQKRISHIDRETRPGGPLSDEIYRLKRRADSHDDALDTPNVVKVVATKTIPADGAATADALCPEGHQVLSGGYIQGALNGIVTRAVPIQKPGPGFEVQVIETPGIATGNQDAQLTVVAYCAPFASDIGDHPDAPVVPGNTVPSA
jgi:hypothetical protein